MDRCWGRGDWGLGEKRKKESEMPTGSYRSSHRDITHSTENPVGNAAATM